MREIEFRGKWKDNGERVYGGFTLDAIGHPRITVKDGNGLLFPEVIPKTVGQYTGLNDRNGNRIYEGDIILFDYVNIYKSLKGVVSLDEYFHSCVKANTADRGVLVFHIEQAIKGEVIGNIHDSPELAEENNA
jgi:hypothetical protein